MEMVAVIKVEKDDAEKTRARDVTVERVAGAAKAERKMTAEVKSPAQSTSRPPWTNIGQRYISKDTKTRQR